MAEKRWMNVPEAAAYLGIAADTVYDWIHRRGLPAHRLGRLWRIDPDEVDEWLKSGKANGEATDPAEEDE